MFEWDNDKRLSNLEKHGVDFALFETCDWYASLVIADERRDYGEPRFIAFLPVDARLHVVVYAQRGTMRRLISARKANAREVWFYETQMDTPD